MAEANPYLNKLFVPLNKPLNNGIGKGSLILFNYSFWQHDPTPLTIVTDVFPGQVLRGVNLHYLTFTYIKNLLTINADNTNFSYQSIKGNKFLQDSFRSYKYNGITNVRKLDAQFILAVMATTRALDANQVHAIRLQVQDQLNRAVNPPAVPNDQIINNSNGGSIR